MQFHGKVLNNRFYGFTGPARDIACFLVFRPSDMGHEYRPSAALDNVIKRAEGPVYPVGVFYLAVFYDIVVKPDKNDLAVEVRILNQTQP